MPTAEPAGLTSSEAARRLASHGRNELPAAPGEPGWRRFTRQFESPIIYILLVALVIDLGAWGFEPDAGTPVEAIAIAVILLFNAMLGVWQERKAEDALAKLKQLAAPTVVVRRNGRFEELPAAMLVPDDVIRLEAGNRVPADATLDRSHNLMVDESVVTGESIPIDKRERDELRAGTLVVRGTSVATVTATGRASTMGRLATMLGRVESEKTPLERRLTEFGNRVARWVLTLAFAMAALGLAAEGLDRFSHVFLFAVALAVAALPDGLPAVLTVTLALGVERMARRHAVVRRLSAVEALGSVTVIVTDKTGTLTENRMEVRALDIVDEPRALRAMVLASEAEGDVGDPIELALLARARENGVDPAALRAACERVSIRPFDADWKFARTTVREDGRVVSYVKGAPEVLLERSRLDVASRADWERRIERHAAEGFRVLAVAAGEGESERELQWLGLVLLWDPPRPEVPDAVRRARAAGIHVVMATGDHPETARTVAHSVGIDAATVTTGDDFDRVSDSHLAATTVFARVSPEHKLRLVERLQARGEIVAMTGDGVNDAPALKRADVGVAMGQRGSDVTREVADLVLLDDNFATIVAAIEEGRGIYENIQSFVRFLFSTNMAEVLVVALGTVATITLGMRDAAGDLLLPLTAAQLLWINLVTDGAPALALGVDQAPAVMERPPRPPSSPLLDRRSLAFVALAGGTIAVACLGLLWGLPGLLGLSLDATRSVVFVFIAMAQLVIAYPARSLAGAPLANQWLRVAVVGSLAAQVLVVTAPGLRGAFESTPLGLTEWGVVAVGLAVVWGIVSGGRRLLPAR